MVPYPSEIERHGPLIHSWTMRQESKLSFVKRIVKATLKTFAKLLQKKHLFWMCYQLQNGQNLLKPSVTFSTKFRSCTLLDEDQCVHDGFLQIAPEFHVYLEINMLIG